MPRDDVLREALDLTMGDRDAAYGDPTPNRQRTAAIFNAITGHDLTARDAALFQVAEKLSRLSGNPEHRDSYVDCAAYIAITQEVTESTRGEDDA